MEKYLRIHWSIQIILGILLSLITVPLISLVLSVIYILIYHAQIQQVFDLFGVQPWQYIVEIKNTIIDNDIFIPTCIGIITYVFFVIFMIIGIFKYKRWMIGVILGIFIPASIVAIIFMISSSYMIPEMYYTFSKTSDINMELLGDYISWILFFMLSISIIYSTFSLICLFREIKKEEHDENKITDKKTTFGRLFLWSLLPFIGIIAVLIDSYNPIHTISIPDSYFQDENMKTDIIYTDPKICKQWIDILGGVEVLPDNQIIEDYGRIGGNTGAKLMYNTIGRGTYGYLLSLKIGNENGKTIEDKLNSIRTKNKSNRQDDYFTELQNRYKADIADLIKYRANQPELWNKTIQDIKTKIPNEKLKQLQDFIQKMPDNFQCKEYSNLVFGEFPDSYYEFDQGINFLELNANIAILEGDTEAAIDIVESLDSLYKKLVSVNVFNYFGKEFVNRIISTEYTVVERILAINSVNESQLQRLRKLYEIPYDMKEHAIRVIKSRYYTMNHLFSSLKGVSIPYIFDGKDTINRLIIEKFAPALASISNDTRLQNLFISERDKNQSSLDFYHDKLTEYVSENIILNLTGGRKSVYNYIGRGIINNSSETNIFHNRNFESLYQEYIRYNLLGIEKK